MNKLLKKMQRLLLTTLVVVSILASLRAQHCGTSQADQQQMVDFIQNKRAYWNTFKNGTENLTYVPVRFHNVGLLNGTGRVSVNAILNQLCQLNTDYEPYGVQFYLKDGFTGGIRSLLSNDIYNNPSSSASVNELRNTTNRYKDAVNIFIGGSANSGSGGVGQTLGFYSRTGDYIVMLKTQVQAATTALAHELGHYFGLPHTFFGWEATEYDCGSQTPLTVGGGVLVEYVSRTKQRNGRLHCLQSADGLCDTPADYNLGFGWSGGCNYAGCAKDRDEVDLDPSESNYMSYFLGCLEIFSNDQVAVMEADRASSRRNYIRSSYVPDLTQIANEEPILIEPENRGTTTYYDEVTFSWEPVENAETYVFELDRFNSFNDPEFTEFVTGTSITVNDLVSNRLYYWRVRPVHEYRNCVRNSQTWRFRTGAIQTSVFDQELNDHLSIINNPSDKSDGLSLGWTGNTSEVTVEVLSSTGQSVYKMDVQLQPGANRLNPQVERGLYLIRIEKEGRFASKKWIVQ
jgi:hypothetical protein